MIVRLLLFMSLLFLVFGSPSSSVQGQTSFPALPETTPPQLIVVVILDETVSMRLQDGQLGGSTIQRLYNPAPNPSYVRNPAAGSDEQNRRRAAVNRMIDILNADRLQTHKFAVVRMDEDVTLADDWFGGDAGGIGQFITLGAGVDQSVVDDFKRQITGMNSASDRGGDATDAFWLARAALDSALGTGEQTPYKPLIVWITDDPPSIAGASTPIQGGGYTITAAEFTALVSSPSNPLVDNRLFSDVITSPDSFMTILQSLPTYLPDFDPLSECFHNNNQLVGAIMAMGTPNWLNADATMYGEPSNLGRGMYYDTFATNLGWLRGNGQPLVWAIDPRFEGAARAEQDFRQAVSELMSEIRCQPPYAPLELVTNASQANVQRYSVEVSAAYRQITFVISMAAPVLPTVTNTTTRNTIAPSYSLPIPGDGYTVMSFTRDQVGAEDWSGHWDLSISSTETAVVDMFYDIDLTEAIWRQVEQNLSIERGTEHIYQVEVQFADVPLTDETETAVRISGAYMGGNQRQPLTFTYNSENHHFEAVISEESGGSYDVSLYLTPRFYYSEDVNENFTYSVPAPPNNRFSVNELYGINSVQFTGGGWRCEDNGYQEIEAEVNVGSVVNSSSPADIQAAYAAIPVEGYIGTPNPSVTPIQFFQSRILPGTVQPPPFVARVDCADIPRADDQEFWVVARIGEQPSWSQSFDWNPTNTPLPTYTPTPMATPTLTPTPQPYSSIDDLEDFATLVNQPFVYVMAASAGVGLLGAGGFSLFRRYDRSLLLLRRTRVRCDDLPARLVIPRWLSWVPGQRATLMIVQFANGKRSTSFPLIEIHSEDQRRSLSFKLVYKGKTERIRVDGQELPQGTAVKSLLRRTELQFASALLQGTTYEVRLRITVFGFWRLPSRRLLDNSQGNTKTGSRSLVFHNPFARLG